MSKETREHLSALVDGEISKETSRFLVRRLGADDELRETWTRYHLIRDCLRHQDDSMAGADLSERIGLALEDDQPVHIKSRALPNRWLKPFAGMAIAASVALMAVVTVGPGIPGGTQSTGELADELQAKPFTSPQSRIAAPNSNQANFSAGAVNSDQKMNSYLLRHYQASGTTSGKNFVTFVPIVVTRSKTPDVVDNTTDLQRTESGKDVDSELQ